MQSNEIGRLGMLKGLREGRPGWLHLGEQEGQC